LARPGGNVTGLNFLAAEVTAKRLELLRAMVPGAVQIAVLVNPEAPVTETTLRELEDAAATSGLRIRALKARSSGEINTAFATFVHARPDALFVSGGFLFSSRQVQLVHLATRHGVPAAYGDREYVEVGGLMSYGTNLMESLRQVGIYAGRILKGTRPADLPVMQSTKLELVINAETARTLGLTVPPSLVAIADEVIE
jgi:putative ABC transport system substrate-binding protein